ncbi:hypothetical protein NW759_017107 [Fusarium solani]|nr:hypothetical protein NW759_017107 [Fusarium solani]
MAGQITRVTLFKIPKEEDQQRLLDLYKAMPRKALKNGKPYIASVKAGKAAPDQRAQGFTVVALSVFSSIDDFNYYDTECIAHGELKQFAKTAHQGVAMVFFENLVSRKVDDAY